MKNDSKAWAEAIVVADILGHGHRTAVSNEVPRLLIQQVTHNVFLSPGPVEYFSNKMPVWVPPRPEDADLRPIDVLYGRYIPSTQSVEIYVDRIRQDAPRFGCTCDELLEIVRLHEYAHATTHLGVNTRDMHADLKTYGPDGRTDWKAFVVHRDASFSSLDEHSHELLAQIITYASFTSFRDPTRSRRFQALFDLIEAKQPPQYKVPPPVKPLAHDADWGLVLEAARGSIDPYRGPAFSMPQALGFLIADTAACR